MKNGKKTAKPQRSLPPGWFLMSGEDITVRSIKDLFPEHPDIEIWEEAGVLEIVLGEKMSMDIEEMSLPKNPEDAAYFSEKGIRKIFYISFKEEAYDIARPMMDLIVKAFDAEICGDTPDLTPVIR